MKNFKTIFLPLAITIILSFAGCVQSQDPSKSVLNIQPRIVQNYKPEEKAKVLAGFKDAAQKEDSEKFATLLAQIYERGLQGDSDFVKTESALYVKGTEYFEEGLTDQAYKMANTIHSKVFESWRFKYLKIRCLERYGNQALEKKDYAKAKDYAQQILQIEYRPEGANLTAKIAIQEAQAALKKNDQAAARAALMVTSEMEIDPAFRKQIDEMMKSLGN